MPTLGLAYVWHIDFGDAGDAAGLFTEDGVIEFDQPGLPTLTARESIREFFHRAASGSQRTSRHVLSNEWVEVLDDDRAIAGATTGPGSKRRAESRGPEAFAHRCLTGREGTAYRHWSACHA